MSRALDRLDALIRPLAEPIGVVAMTAARVEFGLALVRSSVTGLPVTFGPIDRWVKEVRRAVRQLGAAETDHGQAVINWAKKAAHLLGQRGELLHSIWSQTSDIHPDDWRRMGHEPPERVVHSTRLRDGEGLVRTADSVHELADALSDHMEALVDLWGILQELGQRRAQIGPAS